MSRRISTLPGFIEFLFPYALSQHVHRPNPPEPSDWYRNYNRRHAARTRFDCDRYIATNPASRGRYVPVAKPMSPH